MPRPRRGRSRGGNAKLNAGAGKRPVNAGFNLSRLAAERRGGFSRRNYLRAN